MWGLVAGQKPPKLGLNTIEGYFLVILGVLAVGKLFVEDELHAQQRKTAELVGANTTE
jgi:hypothetical protein